jgi:hypothetical protein
VAVGAPMMNATLTVLGANGQIVSTPVDASGSYSNLNIAALTAPYRLQACGQADGQYACYYSVVQSGTVADVTPLTDAEIALALGNDASTTFTNGSIPSASALANSASALSNELAPLLAAAGVQFTGDFATLPFTANHTGLDKVLDAVKITTGNNNGATYVQMEGVLGYGNAYVDNQGNSSGSLGGSALVSSMNVNLTGISTIFNGLNSAIASGSISSCESAMSAQVPFDSQFSLDINGQQQLNASTAPAALCTFASSNGLLGGQVENPTLQNCFSSGADRICEVNFDLSNGTVNLQGGEMAVVLRQGASNWTLLGNENAYGIQVGSAVSRTLNVGVANPQPTYTRNLSFDIPDTAVGSGQAPNAAKVYIHDASGTGSWDTAPIAVLSDTGCTSSGNLTIVNSQCGGEWLSIDNFNSAEFATGDDLINALDHRGLDLRIDLYQDAAATTFMTSVYTRVNGLPPQLADLPNVPWLNLDSTSQSALAAYASGTGAQTLPLTWSANPDVVPHDLSFCTNTNCDPEVHMTLSGSTIQTSATMDLSTISVTANGYKRLSLYGRDRNEVGFESDYVSSPPN